MKRIIYFIILCFATGYCYHANGTVTLPQFFADNMVMQRGKPIPVWGKAAVGETVHISFNHKRYSTVADDNGKWRIDLPKMKAGGPYTMQVGDKTIKDILIGDVWLCSGQSNIDVTVDRVSPVYLKEVTTYENNRIRLFRVQNDANTHSVQDDVKATSWNLLTPSSAQNFSAVGYFLAKRMFAETNVPQGIICNSYGGTPVQAWVCKDSLRDDFPVYSLQTEMYENDEYVAAQQKANLLANNRWTELLNREDPGVRDDWTATGTDDSGWKTVNQYNNKEWALNEGRGVVGSIWMRQHINIDAAHAGKKARLLLGRLYDADYTYVNGKEVGRTYYQYPPRRYEIPEGLLHEGDNVITVRFVNKGGIAEFDHEKKYEIDFEDGKTISLSENWRTHIGKVMPLSPEAGLAIQNLPYVLYNAMLYPLHPYAISGVVWYQGESNTGRPYEYGTLLKKMMGNWRTLWNEPDLPFVIVQLANYMAPVSEPQNSNWAALREQQRRTALGDKNAELVTAIDLGETTDIHPLHKKELTERIASAFDKMVYDKKKAAVSPKIISVSYSECKVDKGLPGLAVVTFDQQLKPGDIKYFELAGEDGRFYNVTSAHAEGNNVVITSTDVCNPKRIRYAYKDNPIHVNLYGINGYPVPPFEY